MVFNCFILNDWLPDFPFEDGASILVNVENMRKVRNNVNTSSKTKKATLTYKEAVLKQNKIVEKIANRSEEKPILNKREPHAMFIN